MGNEMSVWQARFSVDTSSTHHLRVLISIHDHTFYSQVLHAVGCFSVVFCILSLLNSGMTKLLSQGDHRGEAGGRSKVNPRRQSYRSQKRFVQNIHS